jgi:hypothetical protein
MGHSTSTVGSASESASAGSAVGPTPRHRKHHRLLIALVSAALLLVGGYLAWGWLREDATPVSLEDASKRFEREHSGAAQGGAPLQPAEGVYRYRGHGSDHLSAPPLTQDHGPGMPGTVTHTTDGCWTFRIDYSSNHWEDWEYCARDGGLRERSGRTFQRWDLGVSTIDNHSTFRCESSRTLVADMQPGDEWLQTCSGKNDSIAGTTTSAGPMRFIGVETVRVGKERVSAYHLEQRREISGGQEGTLLAELWFAPDGLPLRERHTISVTTSSPIGSIDYQETTDFALTSLTPRA